MDVHCVTDNTREDILVSPETIPSWIGTICSTMQDQNYISDFCTENGYMCIKNQNQNRSIDYVVDLWPM